MQDPYEVLGVSSAATETELHAAYRKLVQRHHPDHNNGSLESARRFEEVQEAYARVRAMRAADAIHTAGVHAAGAGPAETSPGGVAGDDSVAARLADLERQVREAQAARTRAEAAAADARRRAQAATSDASERAGRASDEELGYVTTDDSFTDILDDAASRLGGWLSEAESELGDRVTDAQRGLASKRVRDLIEELEGRLRRKPSG
ncbi:MAG: DnaJ domain-containing protein [Conexibacteraceae bacterium]|nr:DnaJ domain-containing protein [Conexibacteraceae bacterium]